MALLKKLEDSIEGLIGITEEGKRVHLGIPMPFSCIHNLGSGDYEKLSYRDITKFEQSLRSDEKFHWYFDSDSIACCCPATANDNLIKYTYTGFEMKKQEAFELNRDAYPEGSGYEERYVKIRKE